MNKPVPTAKVSTAATIWLRVKDEAKQPSAIKKAPYNPIPKARLQTAPGSTFNASCA